MLRYDQLKNIALSHESRGEKSTFVMERRMR